MLILDIMKDEFIALHSTAVTFFFVVVSANLMLKKKEATKAKWLHRVEEFQSSEHGNVSSNQSPRLFRNKFTLHSSVAST